MNFQSPILAKFTPLKNDKFGWRDLGSGRHHHNGVDLRGGNLAILASADGKVTRVEYHPNGYGNCIYINHGNGWETRYAHLANRGNVNIGQQVKAGQRIGTMGTTGLSFGVHLHFEIRYNGNAKNPENYIDFANRASKGKTNITVSVNKPNQNNNLNNMPNFTIPRSEAISDINKRNGFDAGTKKTLVNAVYDNNFSYIVGYSGEEPRKELKRYREKYKDGKEEITVLGSKKEASEDKITELELKLQEYEEKLAETEENFDKKITEETEKAKAEVEDTVAEKERLKEGVEANKREAKKKKRKSLGERDFLDTFGDFKKNLPAMLGSGLFSGLSISNYTDLGELFGPGTLSVIATALIAGGELLLSYQHNHSKNERKIQEEEIGEL
jgi:hypothetical protein